MSSRNLRRWLVRNSDPLGAVADSDAGRLSPSELRQLIEQADAHAVLPAVMNNLPEWAREGEHEAAWRDGLTRRRLSYSFAMMLRHQADAILSSLRGAPVALVKGWSFARTIYPNPLFRTFTDIDLLIDPATAPRVREVLTERGFRFHSDDFDPELMEAKWINETNPSLMVEVHDNMIHHPGLRRSLSLSYEDLEGRTDTPASRLAIAAIHGASHQFERLQQAIDIRQAARALTSADEEERFLRLVNRCGARLASIAGLELAERLYSEPRCREIRTALGPERYSKLSRRLVSPAVVASTKSGRRVFYSWRRNVARELLKRGRRQT